MWIMYWTSKENIKKIMKDISMIIKIKIVTVMLFPIHVKA